MTMPYHYEKAVDVPRLRQEILNTKTITKALDNIGGEPGVTVDISFLEELPSEQQTILTALVDDHINEPLVDNVIPIVSTIENPNAGAVALNFKLRPLLFSIPAGWPKDGNGDPLVGAPYWFNYASPYPIMLLGAVVDTTAAMVGDSFELALLDNTIVGLVVANASTGDTTITLSPGATSYIYPGFRIGGVSGDWGEVKSISGNVVTLVNPLSVNITAGSYALIEYSVVEKMKVMNTSSVWTTRDTQRGANIPANQPMELRYWNTTGTAKEIQLNLSFYL